MHDHRVALLAHPLEQHTHPAVTHSDLLSRFPLSDAPDLTRFNQSSSSRSSWLIAIRSILQPYGCQEELSTWLKPELLTWPRHSMSIRFASLLILISSALSAAEPIRLHPQNPHYFEFRGKPTILITSGEHYGAVLNLDFDYKKYLATLAADRLNMTRTFTGAYREGPQSFGIEDNTLAPAHDRFIAPWPRSQTPGAADGLTKFDLTRWNDAYFTRLRDFVREAGTKGIVVELPIFCPFYRDEMWDLSPLNAKNNVNGIGNYPRQDVYTLKDPAMQKVQDALVRKIVAELKEFDNLLYEIANEPYAHELITADWERHIADVITNAESGFPTRQRHLITQNVSNGSKKVPNPNPQVSVFNFHYSRPPASVGLNRDLNRPIGCNETGFDGQADAIYRIQGWGTYPGGRRAVQQS